MASPGPAPVLLRPLVAGDYVALSRIFFCAVHEGTRGQYSAAQRLAWAGASIDLEHWRKRVATLEGLVAERESEALGFMTLDAGGYIDLAFVLPSRARKGIGAALLGAIESRARSAGMTELSTAASLVAEPFFSRHGWQIAAAEEVTRKNVALRRFQMRKRLP